VGGAILEEGGCLPDVPEEEDIVDVVSGEGSRDEYRDNDLEVEGRPCRLDTRTRLRKGQTLPLEKISWVILSLVIVVGMCGTLTSGGVGCVPKHTTRFP
jgi:hypothetical protein